MRAGEGLGGSEGALRVGDGDLNRHVAGEPRRWLGQPGGEGDAVHVGPGEHVDQREYRLDDGDGALSAPPPKFL